MKKISLAQELVALAKVILADGYYLDFKTLHFDPKCLFSNFYGVIVYSKYSDPTFYLKTGKLVGKSSSVKDEDNKYKTFENLPIGLLETDSKDLVSKIGKELNMLKEAVVYDMRGNVRDSPSKIAMYTACLKNPADYEKIKTRVLAAMAPFDGGKEWVLEEDRLMTEARAVVMTALEIIKVNPEPDDQKVEPMTDSDRNSAILMQSKYQKACSDCGEVIKVGQWILWSKESKKVCHMNCEKPDSVPPPKVVKEEKPIDDGPGWGAGKDPYKNKSYRNKYRYR